MGFGLWILYAISGIGRYITTHFGQWPLLIIGFTIPYIMGIYIGDWMGKEKRL